jgi:hypothetical protein
MKKILIIFGSLSTSFIAGYYFKENEINIKKSLFQNIEKEESQLIKKINKYGYPSKENIHYFEAYISSISYEKRIPNWVFQTFENNEEPKDKIIRSDKYTNKYLDIPKEFKSNEKVFFHID